MCVQPLPTTRFSSDPMARAKSLWTLPNLAPALTSPDTFVGPLHAPIRSACMYVNTHGHARGLVRAKWSPEHARPLGSDARRAGMLARARHTDAGQGGRGRVEDVETGSSLTPLRIQQKSRPKKGYIIWFESRWSDPRLAEYGL